MKKHLLLIICFVLVLLTGCEKEKKKDIIKDEVSDKITDTLYTDDKRLVYDNNGIYKLVFYYSEDKITGLEHYYMYADIDAAKEQYNKDKEQYKDNETIKEITQKGKYVVFTMSNDEYKDKTVDDIKDSYSYLVPVYKR